MILVLCLAAWGNAGAAENGNRARLLNEVERTGKLRVIIQLDLDTMPEGKILNRADIASQRNRIRTRQDELVNKLGISAIRQIKKFKYIPYLTMELDKQRLEQAYADPSIKYIYEDKLLKPSLDTSVPLIGADTAWDEGYTGSGQVIAILDTGVDATHPFLSGKVVDGACFSTNYSSIGAVSLCPNGQSSQDGVAAADPNTTMCDNDCDHGTHVAGIAAGNDPSLSGITYNGVAKYANIIAIQVFTRVNDTDTCDGESTCILSFTSDLIKGLERVYELRSGYNIAAVNMSLGGGRFSGVCDDDDPAMKAAIDQLRAAGIATVVASGNDSYTDGISTPACISSAISVGATTDADSVASFSNSAGILDLLAPGTYIRSSIPGGGTAVYSGTSMATPHVAGAFAILRSKDNAASVSDILFALKSSGIPITDNRNAIRKPRIQVDAALQRLDMLSSAAALATTPATGLIASGIQGGPFSPSSTIYTLSNTGTESLDYAISENVSWLSVTPASGTLQPQQSVDITIAVDSTAQDLAPGNYTTAITIQNLTNGAGDTSREMTLTVTSAAVSNDKFVDSIHLLQSSGSTYGTNTNATKELNEPNHAGDTGGRSVWWRWTAPASGEVTFDTIGSDFDTTLAAYTGTVLASLVSIASNDDIDLNNNNRQSSITFNTQAGVTYNIAVDGYQGDYGNILLNWNFTADATTQIPLSVSPTDGFSSSGVTGGPFSPDSITYTLTNLDTADQSYEVTNLPTWLMASPNSAPLSGTLSTGDSVDITLTLNTAVANNLSPNEYTDLVLFNTVGRAARLSVQPEAAANDFFDSPDIITAVPASVSGNNINSSKEPGEPSHGGNSGGSSVWWQLVIPETGLLSVDTFNSNFDTTLGVYSGTSVSSLVTRASNDDSGLNLQSKVTLSVTAGETLYIAVDGYNGDVGTIALNINYLNAQPPANDNLASATDLNGIPVSVTGTNENATKEAGEPALAGNNGGKSVWWRWTSPITGTVVIDTLDSDFDTLLGVFSGTGISDLKLITDNDDAGNTLLSKVSFDAVTGNSYYIAVDGYNGDSGNIGLSITPLNAVTFSLATAVTGSGTITSSPAGISCPGNCTASYSAGTGITLETTPASGWVFWQWSGACIGNGPCTLDMTLDRNVTAEFIPDSDNDGMSDAYETRFGLDPHNASDAGSDPDNDGLTSLEEFLLGRNPLVDERKVILMIINNNDLE